MDLPSTSKAATGRRRREEDERLAADRDRKRRKRNEETLEQSQLRHDADRERVAENRANETPDERQLRLDVERDRSAIDRANKKRQHQERLSAFVDRIAENRANESENDDAAQHQAHLDHLDAIINRVADYRAPEPPHQAQLQENAFPPQNAQRRARNRAANRPVQTTLFRAAVAGTENARPPTAYQLGEMSIECPHDFCRAKHFAAETGRLLHSCCHNGQVLAPPLSPYPDGLRELISGDTAKSKNFREHIRQYNNANAFASFGAKMESIPGNGPYCFKISGEVYHLATSALVEEAPADGLQPAPRYGQLFVYDPDAAVNYRMHVQQNAACDREIMMEIDDILRRINPYVENYRRLNEAARREEERSRRLAVVPVQQKLFFVRNNQRDDQRRYNAPVTNKECMYLIETADGEIPKLDLAVHPIDRRGCTRLNQNSRHVDPMVFTLFFPSGDSGYTIGVRNSIRHPRKDELTALEFYSSRIAVRDGFNPLHFGGKLFQQFVVHAYCLIEAQRLYFIKTRVHSSNNAQYERRRQRAVQFVPAPIPAQASVRFNDKQGAGPNLR